MAFYNPLSPSADISGGIGDLLKMLMQYMMIQKMYPQGSGEPTPTGYNPFSKGGIPFSMGGTTPGGMPGMTPPTGLNLNPLTQMGGMGTQPSGGLDMNSLMQLLMQLFSQRTSPAGIFPGR